MSCSSMRLAMAEKSAKKKAISTDTQSAVARRLAEAGVRGLVARFAPAHAALIGSVRRRLRKRLPTAHEIVYEYRDSFVISYSPDERGYEGVLALRADARGVALWFNRGKELPDPEKLLRGSGRQTRSMELEAATTLAMQAVKQLIEEAIARSRAPFARTGRGPIVIRSTAAARRAARRDAGA